MNTWVNSVAREGASDGTPTIWKTMRKAEFRNLVAMQNQPIVVPKILASHTGPEGGIVDVCMEDVGSTHLEAEGRRFPQALEVLRQIRKLPFGGNGLPITIKTLQDEVASTIDVDWIATQLGCSNEQKQVLLDALDVCRRTSEETLDDWLVSSHGDLHPRNILVRGDDLVVIDWEWAGQHSVFRDIYALADMCYPEAEAFLLPNVRIRLRNCALRQAEQDLQLDSGQLSPGYERFLVLERLIECRNVANDIVTRRRLIDGLKSQAMFILLELEKCRREGFVS